jgi:hypothetical protein
MCRNLNLLFLYFAFFSLWLPQVFVGFHLKPTPTLPVTKVFVVVCSVMHKSNAIYANIGTDDGKKSSTYAMKQIS